MLRFREKVPALKVESHPPVAGQFELITGDQKTKSELGAHRGPRAGSPRGVVVATSQRLNVDSFILKPALFVYVSALEPRAGRYDHPTRAAGTPVRSQF